MQRRTNSFIKLQQAWFAAFFFPIQGIKREWPTVELQQHTFLEFHQFSTASMRLYRCLLLLVVAIFAAPAQASDIFWVWHDSDTPALLPGQELAVLQQHFVFDKTGTHLRQRMKPLHIRPGTRVTPVVHAQIATADMPQLGQPQAQTLLKAVLQAGQKTRSGWVQFDFEVPRQQRAFYLDLVQQMRAQLPASIKLSVSALASWCFEDEFISQIAADEVVPMLFALGQPASILHSQFLLQEPRLAKACQQQAIGFARQEAPPLQLQQRYARRYWFSYTRNPAPPPGE